MIYVQVKTGQKLHLAYEAGEGRDNLHLVEAGYLSPPICGRSMSGDYRMTINVPMANECKNCRRVVNARHEKEQDN
jgi:hypothetical protein